MFIIAKVHNWIVYNICKLAKKVVYSFFNKRKSKSTSNIKGNDISELAFKTMIMTILMEIHGLIGITNSNLQGIVLTGSIGSMRKPYDFYHEIKMGLNTSIPINKLPPTAGSIGSAQIAKSVFEGKNDILGIKVEIWRKLFINIIQQ